jgi:C-terminal processing protease CtpA/Prc
VWTITTRSTCAAGITKSGKVEVLNGNVGYLKLDAFASEKDAGSAGAAAMNFLVHTDALIIDLRENGGGGISMFQLLMSYLHDGRQQLSGIHIRASDTDMQIWTHGFVSGPRLADVPVWVLVSERTFSAAEAFAYDLKHMGRGTIVGEVTRGGAHLVRGTDDPELHITVHVPFARAVSPVTGGNWEGVGVQPDLPVPAGEALAVAHAEAIRGILANEQDPRWRVWLERALAEVVEPASASW